MSNLVLEIFAQVVGELEIMDASVDRGIRTVSGVEFAHDRKTRKEIGQTVRRRLEQPVVNWRKAFLSEAVKLTKTLTNLRKAGKSRLYPSLGSVNRIMSSLVNTGH